MKVRAHFHKIPPIVSIRIHINPVHSHSFYYLKKQINIFLLCRSSKPSLTFTFSNQFAVSFLFLQFLQHVPDIVKELSYIHCMLYQREDIVSCGKMISIYQGTVRRVKYIFFKSKDTKGTRPSTHEIRITFLLVYPIEKNEMGGACTSYGGEKRRIQDFG